MSITQAQYESERELEIWVRHDLSSYIRTSVALDQFAVSTTSGKKGIPDGFAFDFAGQSWYIIECELLAHGVWPHIAEQITRFVVAMQNPASLRTIRDRVFEQVIQSNLAAQVAQELSTAPERLLQKIELFIESIQPELLIFIDRTNQDLQDMAQALNITTRIFKIEKFIVNGKPEYHCSDRNAPVIEVDTPKETGNTQTDYEAIALLGGGELETQTKRFKCYRLSDGSLVHLKRSKYYAQHDAYWYGISPSELSNIETYSVTHTVFILGDHGFVKVPIPILQEFLKHTSATKNPDGTVRHYHVLISHGSSPEMYWSNEVPKFTLADYLYVFEG